MAKDLLHQHLEKFKDSFQSGLNSIQQAVQQQTTTLVGSSNFYPTTLVLQTALKSGWLKKLSNVMKHWQRRWFVIKGDNLYYYSSHNDTKPPQGCVFLPCCHVAEQVSKGSDCDKFVFTILPDDSNNYNQESFVLAADSDQERSNWMRIIKKIIYKRHGGAIFGSSLEETLKFETRKNPERTVPEIVEICVEYLRKHGLNEEGLFRLPGLTSMIKKCVELFDRGERPRFEDIPNLDVHTVSSLLKLYIRELPSSLISADLYEGVVRIVMREMPLDPKTSMENLRKLLLTLTKSNYHLLKYLCAFLSEVSKNSATNRMNSHNLSTVFSTAFLRPEFGDDDAALMMATSEARKAVTFVIIENQEWLFNVELTPFGGTVVIEDLLGFKLDDDNTTTTNNNDDDVSTSSSSNNSHSDKEFGRKSPQINEETFKDLLEIDFSEKMNLTKEFEQRHEKLSDHNNNNINVVAMRKSVSNIDSTVQTSIQKTKELNRRGLALMTDKDDSALKNPIKQKVILTKSDSFDSTYSNDKPTNEKHSKNNNNYENIPNDKFHNKNNKHYYENVTINKPKPSKHHDDYADISNFRKHSATPLDYNETIYSRRKRLVTIHSNQVIKANSEDHTRNELNPNQGIENPNDLDSVRDYFASKYNINAKNDFYVEIDNQLFDSADSLYKFLEEANCDTLTKADYKNLVLFLLKKITASQT